MAGKPAEEQINNTGWGFRRYNDELVPPACTVGWEYLPNNKKVVALKKSGGSESLYSENTALTPFTTLTTAPYGAQTRMNSAFAGGGVSNFKPHKAFTYIIQKCNRLIVL